MPNLFFQIVLNAFDSNRRTDLKVAVAFGLFISLLAVTGCGSSYAPPPVPKLTINSLDDSAQPPSGTVTLRSALQQASSGELITFDSSLNGATIELSIVGEPHSNLLGETYNGMQFQGYAERDYGPSALYVKKDVVLDASNLSEGVTIKWTGGDNNPARVLAVYGNLILRNISITGGNSQAQAIAGSTSQPYTLARGGGLAVWGVAKLSDCAIYGNKILGDNEATRDRGALGGGIYANGLSLTNCIVSGNSATGYGAAGGGIYSVGGADNTQGIGNDTNLTQCAVTGNRVTGQSAYGGGIFTLSGGPNNFATMTVSNCTVARNLVEDNPDLPDVGQYYYRGGGIYLGGGSLNVISSTIAENQVNGPLAIFNGKPNLGGGGVAATIGNAHVVENVQLQSSIVVGNQMNGSSQDWYVGSLINFYSYGYNRIGSIDFSQILVPCPEWTDLSRRHYPGVGDLDGLQTANVLDLTSIHHHGSILSAGTDTGQPVVLWYAPGAAAIDQVPTKSYTFSAVSVGYTGYSVATDDFLNHVLEKIRAQYGDTLGSDFGSDFGDLTGVTWYGPAKTWPTDPQNAAWIAFWHNLDSEINGRLGPAGLNDDFWGSFQTGALDDNVSVTVATKQFSATPSTTDQRGNSRPRGGLGDIGSIEK